jgi:hypothetical protein
MPKQRILTAMQVQRLPPMLYGRIRWDKSMGRPVGDIATGFRVQSQEHTVTQFRMGPGGRAEPIPGTGIWKDPVTLACWAAPDEGDRHVVMFRVPDVHLNGWPDGKYRLRAELTGNWGDTMLHVRIGYRRIDPLAVDVVLTKQAQIGSADFEVVWEPWRWRP